MSESVPTRSEWKRLYQAAIAFKDLAPWEWIEETDVFGIQNPETEELGFVSIMGLLGEHLALALYLGAEGLQAFWHWEDTGTPPEDPFHVPLHMQASFEDRGELTKKDRGVIKKLGLKFRGSQAWPMFRSYHPGFLPWYLEAQEARFLAYALEQAVDVALRFKQDPHILTPGEWDSYLVRVPRKGKRRVLVWEDKVVTVPPVEPDPIPISVSVAQIEAVKRLPRDQRVVEMDLFVAPVRIQQRGTRPYMPYMLLSVDRASGLILAYKLFEAEETPQQTWSLVPASVLQQIETMKAVPSRLLVGSPLLLHLVQALADDLGLPVELTNHLPNLARARKSLQQHFG